MEDYYSVKALSHSALSALESELRGIIREFPKHFARRGNYVDGRITCPQTVNLLDYSRDERNRWDPIVQAYHNDPICAQVHRVARKQVVIYRDNFFMGMKAKGKFDLFIPNTLIQDIKVTNAASMEQFRETSKMFNWARQVTFYRDLSDSPPCTELLITGLSATKIGKVFHIRVSKEDADREQKRWMSLAKKYYLFKY